MLSKLKIWEMIVLLLSLSLAGFSLKRSPLEGVDTRTSALTRRSPLAILRLYVDLDTFPIHWWEENRLELPNDAEVMRQVAENPTAVWLRGRADDADVASAYAVAARRVQQIPVFVLYNICHRDVHGKLSAGGARDGVAYQRWIKRIDNALGSGKAILIVEPDAVPDMPRLSAYEQHERAELLNNSLERLSRHTERYIYLDAGHPAWLRAKVIAPLLIRCGVSHARGISINVSNFQTQQASLDYASVLSNLLGGKTAVIDTSRAGNGPAFGRAWCNPPGRALGARPTTRTTYPIDALLWIKRPWESDGAKLGAPPVGTPYREYIMELAHNAGYANVSPDNGDIFH